MTEAAAIARTHDPVTHETLIRDLRTMGVRPGMVMLVHAALSRIGWVCGGAGTLVSALIDAVDAASPTGGTLVMPAQSSELSDPAGWCDPPVPAEWHDQIRAHMPPFNPRLTPTRGMGATAEYFRTRPGVRRSLHPQVSFTALGPEAEAILASQPLTDPFGLQSPLAALRDRKAHVLMIGTGWESCTALHLAERIATPESARDPEGAPMLIDGQRQWVSFTLPRTDMDRFPAAGAVLDGTSLVQHGRIGMAPSHFFALEAAVSRAVSVFCPKTSLSKRQDQASIPSLP